MRHRDHRRDLRPLLRAGLDRHVDPTQLEHVAAHTDVVRVDAGVNLARAGRTARQFVAVIDGAVEVTEASGRTTTAGPGAHIGVAELLHGRPHTASFTTRTECTLVVIFGPAFRAFARRRLAATAA
jgi:CRP-like cAMP-binding protein